MYRKLLSLDGCPSTVFVVVDVVVVVVPGFLFGVPGCFFLVSQVDAELELL